MSDLEWMFTMPRGETLNVGCVYSYSFGKSRPDAVDLPDAMWKIVGLGLDDEEEIVAAGFPHAPDALRLIADALDGQGIDGSEVTRFVYLRNPEGEIVATWDEGRWWTPEESRVFLLMKQVPAVYAMAENARPGVNREMRRRK